MDLDQFKLLKENLEEFVKTFHQYKIRNVRLEKENSDLKKKMEEAGNPDQKKFLEKLQALEKENERLKQNNLQAKHKIEHLISQLELQMSQKVGVDS